MQRTQIYLADEETQALDREAQRRGTTRSHLIREAIRGRFMARPDAEDVRRVFRETAGAWIRGDESDHETGEQYVDRIRTGQGLRDLHGE